MDLDLDQTFLFGSLGPASESPIKKKLKKLIENPLTIYFQIAPKLLDNVSAKHTL